MKKQFDVVGSSKIYFIISGALILLGIICTFVFGVEVDIQFSGGTMLNYAYTNEVDTHEFADKAEEFLGQEVTYTEGSDYSTGKKTIKLYLTDKTGLTSDKQVEVSDALQEYFTDSDVVLLESSDVSPSSGKEFFQKCLVAVAFSSILLIIYITARFKKISGLSAGIFGIVALIHDIFIVYVTFVVFQLPINANFMAVVLTILGYSINDTTVIYDRLRENKKIYGVSLTTRELMNKSINQSLTRSLNTSITTILSMVVVTIVAVIYRVDSIITFSFPLIIGMISGVYSTICLAGPLWVLWEEHKEKKNGKISDKGGKHENKKKSIIEEVIEEEDYIEDFDDITEET